MATEAPISKDDVDDSEPAMAKDLDDLIEEAGSFHRFQYMLIALGMAGIPVAATSMLFMVFGILEPDWWCVTHQSPLNDSQTFNVTLLTAATHLPYDPALASWSRNGSSWNGSSDHIVTTKAATADNSDWSTIPIGHLFKQCSRDNGQGGGATCDEIVFAPGMETIVSKFQLVCHRSWIPALIISLQMVGVFIGSSLAGQLSDSYGRKKVLVTILVLQSLFNCVSAFSVSWQMFTALRILIGATAGGMISIGFGYPLEFIGVEWRALVMAIPAWPVGALLMSLLAWALRDATYVQLTTAVLSLLCLPPWLYIPESVRWLLTKGHTAHAQRVLDKIALVNRRKAPDVRVICHMYTDKTQKTYTIFHIFSSCLMAKTSICMGFMSFTVSIFYYGISFGIKNLSGDFYINFVLMSALEIVPSFLIFHLPKWFGRRWAIFMGFTASALCALAVIPVEIYLSAEVGSGIINGLCMTAKTIILVAWQMTTLFITELYPTVVRNIALGYSSMCSRVAAIVSPYLVSMSDANMFYVVTGVMAIVSALSALCLRETKNQPLQDELHHQNKPLTSRESENNETVA